MAASLQAAAMDSLRDRGASYPICLSALLGGDSKVCGACWLPVALVTLNTSSGLPESFIFRFSARAPRHARVGPTS